MRRFVVEVCRKRGLKVNAAKSKVMVMNGEEGLECEVHVDGVRLEHVSEFKYLGCVLDESSTDRTECRRKVASGRMVAGANRSLVNARDLQIECARALHETLLVPVLMHVSERRRDLELGLYRWTTSEAFLGGWIASQMHGVTKGVDERIDDGVLWWFDYVEMMEKDRIAKRVYVGVCWYSFSG